MENLNNPHKLNKEESFNTEGENNQLSFKKKEDRKNVYTLSMRPELMEKVDRFILENKIKNRSNFFETIVEYYLKNFQKLH